MKLILKISSPIELKLRLAPEVVGLAEKRVNEEIVLATPLTEKLSPFLMTKAGVEAGVDAIHNPTLFEVVTPPGPVARVAIKATPAC